MSTPAPTFKLRLPPDLRRDLERAAATHERSLTGEILARLEASFPPLPDQVRSLASETAALQARVGTLEDAVSHLHSLMAAKPGP
jgi:hypothetical protein